MSDKRVPLYEQIEEAQCEYVRRCKAYPLLVVKGQVRAETAELKIERMAAISNTLTWVLRHAELIKEWVVYTKKITPIEDHAALTFDAPSEVEPKENAGEVGAPPADDTRTERN